MSIFGACFVLYRIKFSLGKGFYIQYIKHYKMQYIFAQFHCNNRKFAIYDAAASKQMVHKTSAKNTHMAPSVFLTLNRVVVYFPKFFSPRIQIKV